MLHIFIAHIGQVILKPGHFEMKTKKQKFYELGLGAFGSDGKRSRSS
jgi:hypothetical protein